MRRNTAAKTSSTTPPSTATRRAICGVRRYGSSTPGVGGRNVRPLPSALAKETHLPRPLTPVERRQELRHDPVDGRREDQVQRDRRDERLDEDAPRRDRVAEQEVQHEHSDGVEDRDDGDGHERRVRAVAAGGFAVAPDPVAADGEHERRQAERLEVRGVDEQPAEEAARGAEDRAAQQRDGNDRHEQQVRHAAEDVDARQQRNLHDGDEEEQSSRLDDVERVHFRSSGTRIATESSDEKSENGVTWMCLNSSTLFW